MLARIWSHLPENIKAIENVKLFTKKLKLLLLDKMFYDMHEYFLCNFKENWAMTYFKSVKMYLFQFDWFGNRKIPQFWGKKIRYLFSFVFIEFSSHPISIHKSLISFFSPRSSAAIGKCSKCCDYIAVRNQAKLRLQNFQPSLHETEWVAKWLGVSLGCRERVWKRAARSLALVIYCGRRRARGISIASLSLFLFLFSRPEQTDNVDVLFAAG